MLIIPVYVVLNYFVDTGSCFQSTLFRQTRPVSIQHQLPVSCSRNIKGQNSFSILMVDVQQRSESGRQVENFQLFDAHCHLQLSEDDASIDAFVSTHSIALMATKPDDWERTLKISQRHPGRY